MQLIKTLTFTDIMEAARAKSKMTEAGFIVEENKSQFLAFDVYVNDAPEERKCPIIKQKIIIEKTGQLYNIHKRSLPVGTDKIVVHGATKEEAEDMMRTMFKAKEKLQNEVTNVIYYDMVPIDATEEEKSVFYNARPVVVENV